MIDKGGDIQNIHKRDELMINNDQECITMSKTYKQPSPKSLPTAFPTFPNV